MSNIVWILLPNAYHVSYAFINIFYNLLELSWDWDMQHLNPTQFYIWCSWIKLSCFVCSKAIIYPWKKHKAVLFYIFRNKVYEAQVAYVKNKQGSLMCFTLLYPPQAQ